MKLHQIQEPGHSSEIKEIQESEALGIDLGTTNSLVAYTNNGVTTIIPDENGNKLIPSIVQYLDASILNVGNVINKEDSISIRSIKRLMGKTKSDLSSRSISKEIYDLICNEEDKHIKLKISNELKLSPIDISAEILAYLLKIANKYLAKNFTKAVITVPAYFDDAARQATKLAAKKAGIEVLRLINEPTAAAFAYGLNNNKTGTYLVYDLGGGTFDISILQMQQGIFKVIATNGDNMLGGDDFDRLIAEELGVTHLEARKIKENLTDNAEYKLGLKTLTRHDLGKIMSPLIGKTIKMAKETLFNADLDEENLDGIILVGGSTKTPFIKNSLQEMFDCPILDDLNPDEIVAVGAAIQAENLTKSKSHLLLDVNPLSLGIETMGGIVEKIIERNTQIPISKAQEFTTHEDGQNGMIFHIVQGEREFAKDCRSLARFELKNIPSMKAGIARVRVCFTIDADGLLNVSAEELLTGVKQEIEVKPTYGLDEMEITNILLSSLNHAEEDLKNRLLQESKTELLSLIKMTESSLITDKNLLNEEEYNNITQALEDSRKILNSDDKSLIDNMREHLNNESKILADRNIAKILDETLKGMSLEEIEEFSKNNK